MQVEYKENVRVSHMNKVDRGTHVVDLVLPDMPSVGKAMFDRNYARSSASQSNVSKI